jgi:HSP20 family protein
MWDDYEERESPGNLAFPGPAAIRSLVEGFLFGEARPLFDLKSRSLRPLYRIEATEGAVVVTLDLPYVEKKGIILTSTENTVEVDAKMKRPVTLRVGGSVQRRVLFRRYTTRIMLPTNVIPEKAKATFRNGLLRVKIPIAKKGNKVKVS